MLTIERLVPEWKTILTPPLHAAVNMAVDLGLMERARRTGEGVFRIYTWERPSLSLGRNQTALGRYRLDRIEELGLDVVRRPTGGRAILHWREITYSVTAPTTADLGLKEAYREINRILLTALSQLGVPVQMAVPAERTQRPSTIPCFATPEEGEMTIEGKKLVGSAQWRDEGALLQHGSILIEDDQSRLSEIMLDEVKLPEVGTLAGLMENPPTATELASMVFSLLKSGRIRESSERPGENDLLSDSETGQESETGRENGWTLIPKANVLEIEEALEWGAEHISHFRDSE